MKNLISKIESLIDNSEYDKTTELVANEFGIKMSAKFKRNGKYFSGDKDNRDIYEITLSRGTRSYIFEFGQSIIKSQHYKDKNIPSRLYTLNGSQLKGGYKINNIEKYKDYLVLVKGEEPTLYDILTCLQKYDVGTFEDFCSEFGYDTDSKKAEKTYNGVVKEFESMQILFSDKELEILSYIQ